MDSPRKVGIFIFNEVELLDFAGPLEVFSVAGRPQGKPRFDVTTIAQTLEPITTRNHLIVMPAFTLDSAPELNIVVVPGGQGTRREMNNPVVIDWLKRVQPKADLILSVCTGALVLAKAGLLDGLEATTHRGAIELLKESAPRTIVRSEARIVDNGRVLLSGGISAGIDLSFYVVSKLFGSEEARKTADYMEYDWRPDQIQVRQPNPQC